MLTKRTTTQQQQAAAPFAPRWAGPIQGHAINVARSFFPKLHTQHEFTDLLQEAYIVFVKCDKAYRNKVDNDAWFMALFSQSLRNHMIGMLDKSARYISIEDAEDATEPAAEDDTFLRLVIKELPPRVRLLLAALGKTGGDRKALKRLRELYPSAV